MKSIFVVMVAVLALSSMAHAEEPTLSDKASAEMQKAKEASKEAAAEAKVEAKKAGRKVKRMAKKAVHRTEEAACMEGDMKCAAKKAANRLEEGKDATVDAAKGAKDEMSK
nr:hypothetical protein CKG001_14070 [Bdellovibrio sp. CKG001]BFD62676.1 hypothetical protein BdHM001_13570 [Bdellovibrio sp. HM001]